MSIQIDDDTKRKIARELVELSGKASSDLASDEITARHIREALKEAYGDSAPDTECWIKRQIKAGALEKRAKAVYDNKVMCAYRVIGKLGLDS